MLILINPVKWVIHTFEHKSDQKVVILCHFVPKLAKNVLILGYFGVFAIFGPKIGPKMDSLLDHNCVNDDIFRYAWLMSYINVHKNGSLKLS